MHKLRILIVLVLVYIVAHLIYTYTVELQWMPPPPPANPDTASIKKKNPDGPLIMREDLFLESANGKGMITKVVMAGDVLVGNKKFGVKEVDRGGYKKLVVSESFIKAAAKALEKRTNSFILFTLINQAYLNLTLNWLCNVYALQNPQEEIHRSTLIVSLDEKSCVKIGKEWKNVTCLAMKGVDRRFNQALDGGTGLQRQLLRVRVNLIAALAEAKVPFVVFEAASMWFKNPMQRLFSNSDLVEDADLVLPVNSRSETGQRFTFSPMVAFPTNGTRRAAQEMRRIMNRKGNSKSDQEILNSLCAKQYMGLVCRDFRWELLADGKWLKMSESERKRMKSSPYIVNNNQYAGANNKMGRQKINGLWFLSPSNMCNLSKARKILAKYV